MKKDIKQLLLDKIFVAEELKQSGAIVFIGELEEIIKYIEELESKILKGK